MSLFSRKKKNTNAAEVIDNTGAISIAIIDAMEGVIAGALQQIPEEPEFDDSNIPTLSQEDSALVSLGFSNIPEARRKKEAVTEAHNKYQRDYVQYVRIKAAIQTQQKALRILMQARKDYGKDTLLVPFDKFQEILMKYDLSCGRFADFVGEIPDEKKNEILSLGLNQEKPTTEEMFDLVEVIRFEYDGISESEYDKEYLPIARSLKCFPFLRVKIAKGESFDKKYPCKDYNTFGDEPKTLFHLLGFTNILQDYNYRYDFKTELANPESPEKFFIAAPYNCLENRIQVGAKPKPSKDPLICAVTEVGILVFTRWGEEAGDAVLQKLQGLYNKLDSLVDRISNIGKKISGSSDWDPYIDTCW